MSQMSYLLKLKNTFSEDSICIKYCPIYSRNATMSTAKFPPTKLSENCRYHLYFNNLQSIIFTLVNKIDFKAWFNLNLRAVPTFD